MRLLHHLGVRSPLWRLFGGTLLVVGTCIGAGMLSLPVVTSVSAPSHTLLSFGAVWAVMAFTALLMLEVSLLFPQETNLISMARKTLGTPGAWIAWATYVLFLYSIMAAYTASSTNLLVAGLASVLDHMLPGFCIALLFTGIFAFTVSAGAKWVDYLNRLFIVGLIASYVLLVTLVLPHVDALNYVSPEQSQPLWLALPILVTSFGFHLLIPSLKTYLRGHVNHLRFSILVGSFIPFVVYGFWVLIIQGIVPAERLQILVTFGDPVVHLTNEIDHFLHNPWISQGSRLFSFFAVVSSFVGVSLGLFDFFADGFKIQKTCVGKLKLIGLTFLPPLAFVYVYPQGFIMALEFAGIFASILLILFPCVMAYRCRYALKMHKPYEVLGGKFSIILAIVFGLTVITIELLKRIYLL